MSRGNAEPRERRGIVPTRPRGNVCTHRRFFQGLRLRRSHGAWRHHVCGLRCPRGHCLLGRFRSACPRRRGDRPVVVSEKEEAGPLKNFAGSGARGLNLGLSRRVRMLMALPPCYAVATTIVCRMGCTSRTPRPENAAYSSNLSPASYLASVYRA